MSKWTLDKILACEEIMAGCWLSKNDQILRHLFLRRIRNGFKYYDAISDVVFVSTLEDCGMFRFFRQDGTEILPPKDKKKIKKEVWVNFYDCGETSSHLSEASADNFATNHVVSNRIACEYFEREIEIDDDQN